MKMIILLALVMSSLNSFAIDVMTPEEQVDYVNQVAKQYRRTFWRAGHINVESRQKRITRDDLASYIQPERNERFEEPLNDDQIFKLYRCHFNMNCRLFHIFLNSEYWGGYGENAAFILLDIDLGSHKMIEHRIYSE